MAEVSFAKEHRVYPDIIKRYQDSRTKALAEQERLNRVFSPDVKALIAQIGDDDKQTMDELNGFIKVYLSKKLT